MRAPARDTRLDYRPERARSPASDCRKFATVSAVALRARASSASHAVVEAMPTRHDVLVPPATPIGAPGKYQYWSCAQLKPRPSNRIEVACMDPSSEAIVIQDHATGALLASGSGARILLDASVASSLDVSCSDGVRSERQLGLRR